MIELRNVSKSFEGKTVLRRFNLTVKPQETLVLLGLSGSGKTTTLKLINGLLKADEGEVLIEGESLWNSDILKLRRKIGYVIQDGGLFPHYNVFDNIAVVPRLLKWPEQEIQQRVKTLVDKLHLPKDSSFNMPQQLSGGQRQRVGLARAMAAIPPILLMDEPFGALDPITRKSIRKAFLEVDELKQTTTVMVTHDIQEAFEMGDRVAIMKEGKILKLGTPAEILEDSDSEFLQEFFAGEELLLTLKEKGIYQQLSERFRAKTLDMAQLNKLT